MKKFLIFLLILLGLAAVCIVTCPDKQAHKDAIMTVVNSKWNEEVDKASDNEWAVLGAALGSRIIEFALENRLEVKNLFVCSLGQIDGEDGPETVSVGILGHVFTTSKEEFSQAFDEAFGY